MEIGKKNNKSNNLPLFSFHEHLKIYNLYHKESLLFCESKQQRKTVGQQPFHVHMYHSTNNGYRQCEE